MLAMTRLMEISLDSPGCWRSQHVECETVIHERSLISLETAVEYLEILFMYPLLHENIYW